MSGRARLGTGGKKVRTDGERARTGGEKARTGGKKARTGGSDGASVMGIRSPIDGKNVLFAIRGPGVG